MSRPQAAIALTFLLSLTAAGCGSPTISSDAENQAPAAETAVSAETTAAENPDFAVVTAVTATAQNSEAYTFAVTIESPDTGCEQYANWWEVVSEEGELLYRRILAHSHVDEQPFERSGGPVAIASDQTVIVRAHMYPTGYGTQAMEGNPDSGFQSTTLAADFATALADADPQPNDCTF
ncbi:MAG: hypothetical protein ACFB0E_11775 [Leptolyngbyaceae cyanobacterium]